MYIRVRVCTIRIYTKLYNTNKYMYIYIYIHIIFIYIYLRILYTVYILYVSYIYIHIYGVIGCLRKISTIEQHFIFFPGYKNALVVQNFEIYFSSLQKVLLGIFEESKLWYNLLFNIVAYFQMLEKYRYNETWQKLYFTRLS